VSAAWASVVVVSWGGSESLLEALAPAREQARACGAELLLVLNRPRERIEPALLARCEALVVTW